MTGESGGEIEPEAEPSTPTPWHFKLLVVALAVYLAWRGVQGIGWVVAHL